MNGNGPGRASGPEDIWRLGISVSNSLDLDQLGLLETHFRVAIGEITRSVLLAGGGILYGGRLDPDGYTTFVLRELQRYTRRDRPLLACLSWDTQQDMTSSQIEEFRAELGLFGQLVCLDPHGTPLPAGTNAAPGTPTPVSDEARRHSLTGLRRYMVTQQVGRVFLGGRRTGFLGSVPGLLEELLLALEAGQPVYLAGGFGGITYDVARLLGVHMQEWPLGRDTPPDDPGYAKGLAELEGLLSSGRFGGLRNGLTEEENRWLAMSHRPGEIASLVAQGLRRVLGERWASADAAPSHLRPVRPHSA